jgi:tetratricopeptide (TPR) repeat protein
MLRLSQIVLVMVVACATAASVCNAQRQPATSSPTSIPLRLIITVDGDAEKAAFATVELMDSVGSSDMLNRKVTDNDGRVTFQTYPGVHRIRITGSSIQPYDGELEIARNETSHLERIRVRHVEGLLQTNESPPGAPVAVVRLNVPASARKAFEKGSEALHQQRWQESRALFETAIREYPQYDLAYNLLGVALIQLNEVESARQSFAKAIEANADFAEAYRNLARISFAERKYEEADTLLTKSLSTDSLNVWALATAANAELMTHRYDEAIAHARQAHSVPHTGLAGVHFVAALALEATQRPSEAVQEYQLYLGEDPNGRDAERAQKAIARLNAMPTK